MMPRFRKKPVVIEAWLLTEENVEIIRSEFEKHAVHGAVLVSSERGLLNATIATLEGEMIAAPGDWIIKGVKGEFYPCKPDIFAATYEPAE